MGAYVTLSQTGASDITGSGTANTLPMFTGTTTIGDSYLSQTSPSLVLANGKTIVSATAGSMIDLGSGTSVTISTDAGASAQSYLVMNSTINALVGGNNNKGFYLGTPTVNIGPATCYVRIQDAEMTIAHGVLIDISTLSYSYTQTVAATGSPTGFLFTGGAHTTLTGSTEAIDINFALNRTVQFSTGAITTQRAFVIQAPTYGVSGAGSTITNAATFAITGAPAAGAGATITNAYALWVQGGKTQLDGSTAITQAVSTSGSPTGFLVTGGAHTTLTASTEAIDIDYNLARTVQFATGAITTQRAFVIQAPTYGFVAASTITNAATFAISGAPVAGTNATITNAYALWVQGGKTQLNGAAAISVAAGGLSPESYLDIVGSTADNLNLPGIRLKGGTTLSTYASISTSSSGQVLAVTCGTGSGLTFNPNLFMLTNSTAAGAYAQFLFGGNIRMRITGVGRVGINGATFADPAAFLEVNGIGTTQATDGVYLRQPNVAHGMTSLVLTDVYGQLTWASSTLGGLHVSGFSDADSQALFLAGQIGTTTPTAACIEINGRKKNGTTIQSLALTERVLNYTNNSVVIGALFGNGLYETAYGFQKTGSANNRSKDNQILYRSTTDATVTELTSDGAAGSGTTNRIVVPANTALSCVLNVCCKQATSANSKQFLRQFRITNNAGTTAVGVITVLGTDDGDVGLTAATITVSANDTDDCLKIEVTGIAGTNLRWTANLVSTEVLYA